MKNFTLVAILLLTFSVYMAEAKVLTVSNSPIGAGKYTDIQTAVNAASPGDTVYVNASSVAYGTVDVNKRITMIGAGYAVTGTQNNLSSVTGTINLDTVSQVSSAKGSVFIGLYASGGINNYGYYFDNITIERCACNGIGGVGVGWVIENCVIYSSSLDLYNATGFVSNCIIRNNFIATSIYSNGVENGASLLIDHNIIEGQISQINYALVTNNIFFYANINSSSNNNYNIYNNNITVYASPDVLPFGTNTGAGNLNNQSFSVVFSNGLTATAAFPALVNYNWHLLSTNAGHNGATDGTDIGMYGGLHPMPNLTGASTLPQVTLLNIKNSSLPLNGTLNYEFKARQQN